jgi:hypothetical protein
MLLLYVYLIFQNCIISLLFKDNESDGYTIEVAKSNIPKNDNNNKLKTNPIYLFTTKSNSNIKPITNSNLHSSTPYIFNNNIKNYENINNTELENLQKSCQELELLNLKDQYTLPK